MQRNSLKIILGCILCTGCIHANEHKISYFTPAAKKTEVPPPKPQVDDWWENFEATSKLQNDWSIWQWLARINIDYEANSGLKPFWWMETIQPLYITPKSYFSTVFVQARGMLEPQTTIVDVGAGYRILSPDLNWLVGVNGFYDTRTRHGIQNWSFGVDLLTGWIAFTANYYGNIGGWKEVGQKDGKTIFERSLNGYDINISGPTPRMPWMRVGATYYHYDRTYLKDINGYVLYTTIHVWGPLELEGGTDQSNLGYKNFIRVRFNFGVPNRIHYTLYRDGLTKKPFPKRTLKKLVLNLVNRDNHIPSETRLN